MKRLMLGLAAAIAMLFVSVDTSSAQIGLRLRAYGGISPYRSYYRGYRAYRPYYGGYYYRPYRSYYYGYRPYYYRPGWSYYY